MSNTRKSKFIQTGAIKHENACMIFIKEIPRSVHQGFKVACARAVPPIPMRTAILDFMKEFTRDPAVLKRQRMRERKLKSEE